MMALLTQYLPEGLSSPIGFLLLGSLAAFIFGMGKVGFGGSLGILSVPIMIYACEGKTSLATGLMLPLLIAADYFGVVVWRGGWDFKGIVKLLPGAAIGIFIAWLIIARFNGGGSVETLDAALKLGIGVISLIFVVMTLCQWFAGKKWVLRPVFWQASLAGGAIGLSSTLAHAAGPVAGMYLLSQKMQRRKYAATSVMLFWIVNQMKLPAYLSLGLINTSSLSAGLYLVPAVLAGAVMGKFLNRRISQTYFNLVVYTALAFIGLHMTYKGYIAFAR